MSRRRNLMPTARASTNDHKKRSARWRLLLVIEVVLGAIGAGAVVLTGLSGLPVWAIVLFCMGLTAATALASRAAVGPESERVVSLWGTVAVLVALLSGTLVYVNVAGPVAFVNYVSGEGVVLSPTAGAPPRSGYDAAVLVAGEEQSAYCYVVVNGKTWLHFRSGWAPLTAFHLPPEAHHDLPGRC